MYKLKFVYVFSSENAKLYMSYKLHGNGEAHSLYSYTGKHCSSLQQFLSTKISFPIMKTATKGRWE